MVSVNRRQDVKYERTLFAGLREKTISECTLRDLRCAFIESLTARKTAERAWVLDKICIQVLDLLLSGY